MDALFRGLARKSVAWVMLVATMLVTALLAYRSWGVRQDDDLLAFLPKDNPAVREFRALDRRFGGTRAALVAIEAGDPFDPGFLARLTALTRELDEEPEIAAALSLTNVEDFTPDPVEGGIRTHYLVAELPKTDAERAALRTHVMAKEHIVGTFLSADGRSIIIYCFLTEEADPRANAELIRAKVTAAFPDLPLYWGGAPFIASYIYDVTRADMRRLIPWAVLVIVVLIVASFRDLVGAVLAVTTASLGVLWARGVMGIAGVDENIVLSSMPVVLFATSSAYPIHVLARYYERRATADCETALAAAIREESRLIAAAGLTTVAGILSFVTMDIEPMREFGVFTAVGVLSTVVLSFTFAPAVIRLCELRGRAFAESVLAAASSRLVSFVHARRRLFGALLVLASGAAVLFVGRVEARMENAAFFAEGSPPDRAGRFLREHFGGSEFLQVMVEGDMNDPMVLREVQRLADRIAIDPRVSSVQHVGQVLALAYDAMSGERRLPPTGAEARQLYALLAGRAALRHLVSDDRRAALVHVKLSSDAREDVVGLIARVEGEIAREVPLHYQVVATGREQDGEQAELWLRSVVSARLTAHFQRHAARGPADADAMSRALEAPLLEADRVEVERRLVAHLMSDESLLESEQHVMAASLARVLVALGPEASQAQLTQAAKSVLARPGKGRDPGDEGDDEDEEDEQDAASLAVDLAKSLVTPLAELWRQERALAGTRRLLAELGVSADDAEARRRLEKGAADALLDLELSHGIARVDGAADGALAVVVSGAPVLYRGLEKSVTSNQLWSLLTALPVVLLILAGFFRSLTFGLIAAVPTVVSLVVVYGIMGAAGVHLDIGTCMLASIIVGDAGDYAVHLLDEWRGSGEGDLAKATAHAGPGIWTSALTVAAGFWVLTLGEAKPLQNVGSLTGTGMICAAVVTFLAVPVLVGRRPTSRR